MARRKKGSSLEGAAILVLLMLGLAIKYWQVIAMVGGAALAVCLILKFAGGLSSKAQQPDIITSSTGDFSLPVVGESRYQETLASLCGGRCEDGADDIKNAELIPEEDNPYDKDAVRVVIQHETVGYLSRQDAKTYRNRFGSKSISCKANIRGGWDRGGGDTGNFGVWLNFEL